MVSIANNNNVTQTSTRQPLGTRLGMIRCEHCGRQFNPHSAARHIPWCAKHQTEARRNKLTPEKQEALERYKWRISYRPSNQPRTRPNNNNNSDEDFYNHQQPATTLRRFRGPSSLHSTPSASSSNSTRTSVASSLTSEHIQCTNTRHYTNQKSSINSFHPRSNGAHIARPIQSNGIKKGYGYLAQQQALKRSVSSVTLTKQKSLTSEFSANQQWIKQPHYPNETCTNTDSNYRDNDISSTHAFKSRAKSVSDLSNISEVVEILAKRMDEIYAQNERLLRSLRSNPNYTNDLDPDQCSSLDETEDRTEDGKTRSLSKCNMRGSVELIVVCHNCKASLQKEFNFCHKCGSKQISSSNQNRQQQQEHFSGSTSNTSANLTIISSPTPPKSSS